MTKVSEHIKSFGVVAVSAGLVLALLLGSVVPAKAAEEKVVKIGLIAAWTGALATETVYLHSGEIDYVRYLNEQGGINGIRVETLWEDFAAMTPKAISAYKRLVTSGAMLVTCPLESAVASVLPRMIRDEIPCIYNPGAIGPTLISKPQWVLGSGPEGENVLCLANAEWIKKNWTEERLPRIGFFHADEPIHNAALDTAIPYAVGRGLMEFVGRERVPIIGVIDMTVEWLRLAAKKPDWVIVSHYGATMVLAVKDAARLELQEKGIKFIADIATLEESILRIVGGAAEGWYRETQMPTVADVGRPDCPMVKTMLEVARRYRGFTPAAEAGATGSIVGIAYAKGWLSSMVATEVLRMAIEEVGFENLAGRAIRDALFSLKDFDSGLGPPITTSEDKPFYNDFYYFNHVEKGELVRIGDWEKLPRAFHYVVTNGEVHTERL